MSDSVEEFNTEYHTRSHDEDDNVKSLNKKLNHLLQKFNTRSFGLESFRWLGPKISALIPDNVKHANSLSAFKSASKKLNIDNYPCQLCKNYVYGVDYINSSSRIGSYFF